MMKLFRNPEVKKICFLYCFVGSAATILALCWKIRFGLLVLAFSAIFLLIYVISTYKRYQRIAELASDINKILHGDERVSLEQYAEGELGILYSEIYKMTVRLREQQQTLQDDKIYLADSLADISHQIRTPLTSINLLVSFLSDSNISNEHRQKLTRELYELLSRIEWLITTLLKISKLDAGTIKFKKETVPFEELIKKSTAALLIPIELRAQTLKLDIRGKFEGDVAWTCEAIGNVVKNCMEHTPVEGRIEITTAENPLFTEIVIADDGNGIAKEDLPHIFERFYKGKNSDDKSFGIGLALARMIITSQRGTIKAENNLPKGAKFTIRFYKSTV